MVDCVGQQLGNYRLVRLLGRGGQASVYLGEHLYLKSHAAIKVLRAELSDEDVAKFLAEGQMLARLRHPQIVRVHDFAVERGTPFLVMDYAPRGTLRQQHPRGSCLSLDTVVTYVRQVATALQYAHNHNMIHRDVKPDNMLLGTHREVLLSDFGIALFAPSPELLSNQKMAGTLPYIAPEQLQGKPCFASDQYALGIVVYEWLCGIRPFEGPYWRLLNQQMSALPPPLREKDPSLPEAVEIVVLKALAKKPEQRYVSVQHFAQALERARETRAGGTLSYDSELTRPLPAISFTPSVTPRQIFLSNSQADGPFFVRLQGDLQRRGITVWNERQSSTLDTLNQENMNRLGIRAVDVIVLVVSSHTRSSHIVREHLRIVALYQRRLVYVWVEGEDLAALLPETGEKTTSIDVIDARDSRYKRALDELVVTLKEETSVSPPLESSFKETTCEPRNPYKGLRAFTQDDATDFFGREKLIGELVDGVKERLKAELSGLSPVRLLAVIGPSGSGKSSVVMAGLLPRLQQNVLPGSEEWIYLGPMVPGVHPLEALALTMASHLPERSLKNIREDLEDDSARGLHLLASHLVNGLEKKVVLFIDQFEEVFNLTTSEDERERFFALLQASITERKGPMMVILTLRADFYDRLMVSSALGRLIQQHQLVVWPMEVDELRSAIKEPAALPDVNLAFEGNLVGDLLYELRGQVGALPLLQFALAQLFERRKDHVLTLQAYQEIGGVRGALAQHAERIYQSLPTQTHQQLGQALFSRLIDPGTLGTDATKRRIPLSVFTLIDPAKTKMLAHVIEVFTSERLLTVNTVGEVATVEVSHEALIGAWNRLQFWLHEVQDMIRLQQAINTDATAWIQHERSTDRLYRGGQLAEALLWRDIAIPSTDEDTFLQASVEEEQRLQALERARRQRYTRRMFVIGGVGVTGMIGTGLLVYVLRPISIPGTTPTPQSKSLPYAYRDHTAPVTSVAWSPDGKCIASASKDNTVQVWDASNGTGLFSYKGHIDIVYSVAWSPDGKHIASASFDETVQVWDASNGTSLFSYKGHTNRVTSVAWSPDGKRIASASFDKTVQVWDASSGTRLFSLTGHSSGVNSVAWSPDGKRIASGGDTVQVWNASNGSILLSNKGNALSVAWSLDGKHIASASDTTVQIWDSRTGILLFSYRGNALSVAWSPDGKRIASASKGNTVQVWEISSGTRLFSHTGHSSGVNSIAWSPDGKRVASASEDNTGQVWDVINGLHLFSHTGHSSNVLSVVWSPDGTRIASASADKTVQIWDAGNGSTLFSYLKHSSDVLSVAWSPDGTRIASASYDMTVQIWDASNGTRLFSYEGHTNYVLSVAWSPDGKRIASASNEKSVQVWDASNGNTLLSYKGEAFRVAWSPDGKRIASASKDNTVQVWDANNGNTLLSYTGHTGSAYSVAWSPDGTRIASASNDSVQVWNASNGTTLFSYKGHTNYVTSVAWSPDGKRIASAGADHTVQIWWML